MIEIILKITFKSLVYELMNTNNNIRIRKMLSKKLSLKYVSKLHFFLSNRM